MNTCRKLLSALLCLALLASILPLGVQPARAAGTDTLNGTGTENDPYLIYDADDLLSFAELVNDIDWSHEEAKNVDACARLETDINLTNSDNTQWTPIAYSSEYPYIGTFDGNGRTIKGLSINNSSTNYDYFGIFGVVGEGGTVKNLAVEGSITVDSTRSRFLLAG